MPDITRLQLRGDVGARTRSAWWSGHGAPCSRRLRSNYLTLADVDLALDTSLSPANRVHQRVIKRESFPRVCDVPWHEIRRPPNRPNFTRS